MAGGVHPWRLYVVVVRRQAAEEVVWSAPGEVRAVSPGQAAEAVCCCAYWLRAGTSPRHEKDVFQ